MKDASADRERELETERDAITQEIADLDRQFRVRLAEQYQAEASIGTLEVQESDCLAAQAAGRTAKHDVGRTRRQLADWREKREALARDVDTLREKLERRRGDLDDARHEAEELRRQRKIAEASKEVEAVDSELRRLYPRFLELAQRRGGAVERLAALDGPRANTRFLQGLGYSLELAVQTGSSMPLAWEAISTWEEPPARLRVS